MYIVLKINNDFSIETLLSDELSEYLYFDSISSIDLYDTNKNNIKLLCRKTIKILFWNFIKITIEEKINIECIDDENIVFTISNNLKEKNCYLSIFDQFYFALEQKTWLNAIILIKINILF